MSKTQTENYWTSLERAQECRALIRAGGLHPEEEKALIQEVYRIERYVESIGETRAKNL